MRPLSDLVGRFPRALRDMERNYNKQVQLKITGGSTLIDRAIIEVLGDPLLHLLRNAFDHGIEDPATRIAQGKPPQGLIEISAAYRGNQTVITLRDDGGGIDVQKIRAKALEMGFDESDLAQAKPSDLLDLIFEPGFSTAKKVTDISGRGVGMDIVRTKLQQVRGQIHVDSRPGVGTTFTLTVPFTLSVVRVLLVESGGLLLAIPTTTVEEMVMVTPEMVRPSAGQELIDWEGYLVPLIRLHHGLNLDGTQPTMMTDTQPIINVPTVLMIAQGTDLIGLEVDRYWGELEVTTRPIEGKLSLPQGFTGCTILGDGRVVPLVDPLSLLGLVDHQGSSRPEMTGNISPETISGSDSSSLPPKVNNIQSEMMVMVVDDSITVRRFLAFTLEKAGYIVQQAKDGQEALEKLDQGLPIQSVICDIEMPRLDGYGFLAHVKAKPDYTDLPVVMLTSRSGEKHRQIALKLGATAYFSKPFQEQELLETLKSLPTRRTVNSKQ